MSGDTEGVVLRVERTSIHDGQGLRTVLFLKGCPLACLWCSTPESQNKIVEKGYLATRCVGCGTCVENCPVGALLLVDGIVQTRSSLCQNCFTCVAGCPQDAHKGYGQKMTVDQVVAEICKDEIFYFHSGGGVTISGGECLLQPDFVAGVLKECQRRGIDTAIETSLFAPWQIVEGLLPFLNTLYVDIKHPDGSEHKKLVGVDNDLIMANLNNLDLSNVPFELHMRIPLIPNINDGDDTLLAILAIGTKLRKLKGIEILPYHRLGVGTYTCLGRPYELENIPAPSWDYIIERTEFLRKQGGVIPVKVGGGYI